VSQIKATLAKVKEEEEGCLREEAELTKIIQVATEEKNKLQASLLQLESQLEKKRNASVCKLQRWYLASQAWLKNEKRRVGLSCVGVQPLPLPKRPLSLAELQREPTTWLATLDQNIEGTALYSSQEEMMTDLNFYQRLLKEKIAPSFFRMMLGTWAVSWLGLLFSFFSVFGSGWLNVSFGFPVGLID